MLDVMKAPECGRAEHPNGRGDRPQDLAPGGCAKMGVALLWRVAISACFIVQLRSCRLMHHHKECPLCR